MTPTGGLGAEKLIQGGKKMTPKCGLGVEKLLQGRKKEPARSPEAKIVILAESYSKIWKGLWAIWADGNPSPLPPRTAF